VVLTWGALEWTIIDESWNMHRIILAQAFALAATAAFARGGGHSSHHYVSTIVGTIVSAHVAYLAAARPRILARSDRWGGRNDVPSTPRRLRRLIGDRELATGAQSLVRDVLRPSTVTYSESD
jgi:hypothetical protein